MTNKDRYKQACSALHPSKTIALEEIPMKHTTHKVMRPIAAVVATVVLLCGCVTVAYAADVGGIRTTIQSWFRGEAADMDVVEKAPGEYEFQIHQNGQTHTVGGGGVEYDMFGNEKPLSPEDAAQSLSEMIYQKDDGTIWLYYKSYAIDITQYMAENGCKLLLNDNGQKQYFDISPVENGGCGYSRSPNEPNWGEDPADYIPIN